MQDIVKNGDSEPIALIRALGPFDATCVVVGAIIGVGIFFTPSRVATLAGSGPLALLAWMLGGIIALLGALTFAELGGLYPRTGGQYVILRDAFGPFVGFLFVFCNATAVQAGSIALIGLVTSQNLGVLLFGEVPDLMTQTTVAVTLVISLMVANCLGVRWGSRIQNITVLAKVATLLAVTGLAALFGKHHALETAPSAATETGWFLGISAALVPVLFSFGGWQQALWIAGEVRRPQRDVPLAILAGTIIVIVVYLLANWAYLKLLGVGQVSTSKALAADAVAIVWPAFGKRAVAAAVAVSAFGVMNAQFLTGPRLVYRMAVEGQFFQPFVGVSRRFATPVPAILLLGAVPLGLLLVVGPNGADKILTVAVLIDGIFFVMTALALLVLRRKQPSGIRPVRVPGYPITPLLFVIGEMTVVIGAFNDPKVCGAAGIGLAWIAGAAACYIMFFRNKRRRNATPLLTE